MKPYSIFFYSETVLTFLISLENNDSAWKEDRKTGVWHIVSFIILKRCFLHRESSVKRKRVMLKIRYPNGTMSGIR